MQKIFILNNDDLFDALEQVSGFTSQSELYNVTNSSDANISKDNILIGNICDLRKLKGCAAHLIGLADDIQKENFPEISVIKKPYLLKDLIGIIKSNSLNIKSDGNIIDIGEIKFDAEARTLIIEGSEIALTEKEAELIALLNCSAGEVISRNEILKEVWQYDTEVDTHTLETHIYRIRQKIGKKNDFIGSSVAGYFIQKNL